MKEFLKDFCLHEDTLKTIQWALVFNVLCAIWIKLNRIVELVEGTQ